MPFVETARGNVVEPHVAIALVPTGRNVVASAPHKVTVIVDAAPLFRPTMDIFAIANA